MDRSDPHGGPGRRTTRRGKPSRVLVWAFLTALVPALSLGTFGTATALAAPPPPQASDTIQVSTIGTQEVGTSFDVTLTLIKPDTHVDNYTHVNDLTVMPSVADAGATFPTSVSWSHGVATVTVTLSVATASQSLTFHDTTVDPQGTSNDFTVSAITIGAPDAGTSSLTPASTTASVGDDVTYTLVLKDAAAHTITGDASGIVPSTVDASTATFGAVAETGTPGTYTFTVNDLRTETFTVQVAVTSSGGGPVTITASDAETTVAGEPTQLAIVPVGSQIAGETFDVTLMALDEYGNLASYTHTDDVTITPSVADEGATLPTTADFLAGEATIPVTLTLTTEAQSLAIDDTTAEWSATSDPFAVLHEGAVVPSGEGSTLTPEATTVTAGEDDTYTLVLKDTEGLPLTGDVAGIEPSTVEFSNVTFGAVTAASTAGTYTFTANDTTAETFTVQVGVTTADVTTPVMVVSPDTETVTAAEPDHIGVAVATDVPHWAGVGFDVTLTLEDAYGNTVDYTGADEITVTPGVADAGAALPTTANFVNGQAVVQPTLTVASGAQTLDITDSTLELSGTSNAFAIVGGAPDEAVSTLTPSAASVRAGTNLTYMLTLVDVYGNPIAGASSGVTPGVSSGTAATVTFGTVTETGTLGTYTFTARDTTVESLTVYVDVTSPVTSPSTVTASPVSVTAAPPSGGGGGVVITPALTLSVPTPTAAVSAQVTITGALTLNGVAYPGQTITFSDGNAGGTFAQASAVTDANGAYSVAYTTPATAGAVHFTFTATASGATATGNLAVTAQAGTPVSFSDVPSTYWASQYINQLSTAGIIGGYANGTFQPDALVTRAQFVKMLALALNLQLNAATTSFKDVGANAWYAHYVAAAEDAGIVLGTPNTFKPNAPVTRQEVAAFLARALTLPTASVTFTDQASIATWALGAAQATVSAGYLQVTSNGAFNPPGTVTRAEAAEIIAKVLTGVTTQP